MNMVEIRNYFVVSLFDLDLGNMWAVFLIIVFLSHVANTPLFFSFLLKPLLFVVHYHVKLS
jgi:hypothetical protein